MTPTDYAELELVVWERALQEQRQAEEELRQARNERAGMRVRVLLSQIQALASRADLLLAEAVQVKCMFRDRRRRTLSLADPSLESQPGEPT